MRKTLDSNSQTFHYWANKVQSEGKLGNVSFRDTKLFSYAALIAQHLSNGTVAITTRKWSPTTNSHQGGARQATRHLTQIFVYEIDYPEEVLCTAKRLAVQEVENSATGRQPRRDAAKAKALTILENANLYAEALGHADRLDPATILAIDIEAVKKTQQAELKRLHLQRVENERVAKLNKAEKLAEWRAGASVYTYQFNDLATALRIKNDMVQTTRGAEIPVEHAKKLWPIVQRVKRSGHEVDLTDSDKRLGVYHLTAVSADGDITVGCHNINYDELAAMAVQLGLVA